MPILKTGFASDRTEDNLGIPQANFTTDLGSNYDEEPSFAPFILAADTHNIANGEESFLSNVGEAITNTPVFLAASVISGVNQLYNIVPTLGNAFGGSFEMSDTAELMESIDTDLGKYYEEHSSSIDTVGFIASSLVPGLAGIRAFRAGQSALRAAATEGRLGTNMANAYKLLPSSRDVYIKKAVDAVVNKNSIYSLTETNLVKAIGAGAGQQVLESAAFEIAVGATMSNSPLIKEQSFDDLTTNIAIGGLLGGAIGGVIDGTRAAFAVKKGIKKGSEEAKPWTFIEAPPKGAPASARLLVFHNQSKTIPAVPDTIDADRALFLEGAGKDKLATLDTKMLTELNTLTGGDPIVANLMLQEIKLADTTTVISNYLGADNVLRLAEPNTAIAKHSKINKALASGDGKLLNKIKLYDLDRFNESDVLVTRQWGDNAGRVTESAVPAQLVDTLVKGESIQVRLSGKTHQVTAGKQSWEFQAPKAGVLDRWDITKSDVMTSNARQIWANRLPPFKAGHSIGTNDPALMEKAYKEFDSVGTTLKFVDPDSSIPRMLSSKDELLTEITNRKLKALADIGEANKGGRSYSDPLVAAEKLRRATGIKFAVVTDLGKNVVGSHRGGDGSTLIKINKDFLTTLPIASLINTLKHEEGHSIFDVLISVGGIPVSKHAAIVAEMEKVSRKQRPAKWAEADLTGDYTYMRYTRSDPSSIRAPHELAADTFAYFSKHPEEMRRLAPEFEVEFGGLLRPLGKEVMDEYITKATRLDDAELASMLNIREGVLSSQFSKELTDDMFAMDYYSAQHSARLRKGGLLKEDAPDVDLTNIPQHTKSMMDTSVVKDIDGNILEGMAVIEQQELVYTQALNKAVLGELGQKDFDKLPDITKPMLLKASPLGAERSLVAAQGGNYGSLAQIASFIGNVTAGLKVKAAQKVEEALSPSLFKLNEDPAAAIEVASLMATTRAIPETYLLNEAGDALVLAKLVRYEEAVAAGNKAVKKPTFEFPDTPANIPIKSEKAREFVRLHIELNGSRRASLGRLRAAQGVEDLVDTAAFYPIPVDERAYPFFATVTDKNMAGGIGKVKTLYANTEAQLTAMADKLRGEPGLTVRYRDDAEAHFKAQGQFEFEKTLHDNSFDVMLKRKGVSAPYYVPTDPQKITSELLQWHKQRANGLVLETVSTKYELAFNDLKNMGQEFNRAATSKKGNASILDHAEEVVKNPYMDIVKTSLDLKNYADYPFWVSANRLLDNQLSSMFASATTAVTNSKTNEDLLKVNKILRDNGYKGAAYDESMELLANHTAPRAVVSNFVQQSNAILATVVLRLDALNAVNNAVGSNVLLGSEARAVIRAIERGDEESVGALAGLMKIKVPGTDKLMLSSKKMVANAVAKFGRTNKEMEFFRDNRFVTSISDQYRWTLDTLSITGAESVKDLSGKITSVRENLRKAADVGEEWTGNKLAEEFNRFVAADVMKQMTDIAVKGGLMDSKTALSYINTFVNRTQGNYLASQRPMLFQGPIGQAIGLFQTYQFNLLQQLLRHVGEGPKKDAMTLLGLQGTIYGMNGMPAFDAINTHIIGTASGNRDHKDAYDVVYGAAGKEAGDWLMYGAASNFLLHPDAKLNLYVRGDINPRQVTLVPTNPADIPIVGAATKFFGNLFNVADQLGEGGDVGQILLQGLEHNGISRPLAGLAQTLQSATNPEWKSYSTTKKGNVIAASDVVNIATFGKLLGGKPMAEAIAVDAAFRLKAYQALDNKRRQSLGSVVKSTMIAGQIPTQEQVDEFAYNYVKIGGKQKEFNKWMVRQYHTANTSQVNALQEKLSGQYSQSMQLLMGGEDLEDFENQ